MSGCTYTPPNSVRTIDPVGHASRHPAFSQCLQTSDENCHVMRSGVLPPAPIDASCSTNFTWRHVAWPNASVLSYESPDHRKPSSGTSCHSLHATSQALHPMHSVESVKKPVIAIAAPRHPERSEGAQRELLLRSVRSFAVFAAQDDVSRDAGPYVALSDIAAQALRFHDPHVRLFGDRDQIVDDIASHQSAITPVIRQTDVMYAAAVEIE